MRKSDSLSYTDKIKWRVRTSWGILAVMLIYMVIVGETGGDSRVMTNFAGITSKVIFFGGILFILRRILRYKKLLKNKALLKEQMQTELEERKQYLHDKSGGAVLDILLLFLLFATVTTALYNMTAFYVSIVILAVAAIEPGSIGSRQNGAPCFTLLLSILARRRFIRCLRSHRMRVKQKGREKRPFTYYPAQAK